jgi:membrane protease subunit HflK
MSEQESNELKPPAGLPAPEPPDGEDPGTQALSEALRSSFYIIQIIMVLLVVVFFGSGFFTVKEQNRAIILRMGRPVGDGEGVLLLPGAHFAFPRPIDEVTNIPFTSLQRADSSVGWFQTAAERAANAPEPAAMSAIDPASSASYMLTADTNIIHLAAFATYRITKPIPYYFDYADAAQFVTNDLDNALVFAASRFTVDDIISLQPTAFQESVLLRMRELVEQQGLGVTVDSVDSQSPPSPPLVLKGDFSRVIQASAEHDTTLSQADIYRSQTLGNARGEKESRIRTAEADRDRAVKLIGAEQTNFSGLLSYYQNNPALVTSLLQADTLYRVWANAQSTVILPDQSSGRSQIRIQLGEPLPPLTLSTNQSNP